MPMWLCYGAPERDGRSKTYASGSATRLAPVAITAAGPRTQPAARAHKSTNERGAPARFGWSALNVVHAATESSPLCTFPTFPHNSTVRRARSHQPAALRPCGCGARGTGRSPRRKSTVLTRTATGAPTARGRWTPAWRPCEEDRRGPLRGPAATAVATRRRNSERKLSPARYASQAVAPAARPAAAAAPCVVAVSKPQPP